MQAIQLAQQVGDRLRSRQLTLAVAESCTGGLLGDHITDVPGSSDYFLGGVLAYSNQVKQGLLGVRQRDAGDLRRGQPPVRGRDGPGRAPSAGAATQP